MFKLSRPLCFIDIESAVPAGCKPDPAVDRIIDLGIVLLMPDGSRQQFAQLFNPGVPITEECSAIHGYTDADVKDAPRFSELAPNIHRGLAGNDLAGFNLWRYDLVLLDEEFRRCGLSLDLTGVHVIDALTIFRKKMPRDLASAVKEYTGRDHSEAHGALEDSEATADVLLGQLERYEDLRELSIVDLADYSRPTEERFADLAGKLYYDDAGDMRYAIGKAKGVRVRDDHGFGAWMLGKDFPGSTKDVLRRELNALRLK